MKDHVFSGRDISEALEQAAQALGLAREGLRYVVLDAGRAGGLGVSPTPARVAVLLDAPPRAPEAPPSRAAGDGGGGSLAATLRALVRSVAEAAQLDLSAEVDESADSIELKLLGPGQEFFQDEEVLPALEHLLRKVLAQAGEERRLLVSSAAVRVRRDQAVRERALALAREVARDGQPRETEPLNSYERRLVHIAIAEVGLTSYSVGEGNGRRVVVAPGASQPPDAEG